MKSEFINEIILGKLKGLISEVGEFNYNKTFIPPDNVARKAKEAISAIGISNNLQQGSNEGSGRQKANELAEKKTQSLEQMKRMGSFFSTNAASIVRIKQQGGPKTDQEKSIMQSWNLHGGEEGNQWVKRELQHFHDENLKTKSNLRKAGGAGQNKGMGVFDTSILDTNKSRIHK